MKRSARASSRNGTLLRQAQGAMLATFERANTVTAAELQTATAEFSESAIERGRAELTREGVLIRGKRGMEGAVTYEIDRERLALFVRQMPNNALSGIKYRSPSFAKNIQQQPRMPNNVFPAEEYDDDEDRDDDDREDDYESAGATNGGFGWIVTALLICGLGSIIFLRRRFASSPIGDLASTTALPPFSGTAGSAPARRFDRTLEDEKFVEGMTS
ncbi:MAG TPA: hypothetical protein VGI19_19250 [Candidatus Cybelea sp.]